MPTFTTQEWHNNYYKSLLSNFCSIICQMAIYRELKTGKKFKLSALKVVALACERCSVIRGSKINIMICLGNFWYFGKLVAEERWLLTRGGWNQSFNCVPP